MAENISIPITFSFDTQVTGATGILGRIKKALRGRKPLQAAGRALNSETQKNMRRGEGPAGRMAPAPRWTRLIQDKPPDAPPLFVTGSLAASLKVKIRRGRLIYGPTGKHRAIGELMASGGRSEIVVPNKNISSGRNGQYVRIFDDRRNQWYTKRVSGNRIPIRVRARNWIGVNNKIEAKMVEAYRKALKF